MASHITKSLAGASFALAAAASPASAQYFDDGPGRMWHGSWGWGGMAMGGLAMFLFWVGLLALVILLVRGMSGGSGRNALPPSRATSLDILEERFARGEIGHEEFEERRRVLMASRAGGGKARAS